jgi:TetR/AcrR family transcriptional regulator, transcriptional repressor for nem operon
MMVSNPKKLGCAIQNGDRKVDCQIHFACYGDAMSTAIKRPAKLTSRGRVTRQRIVAAAAELMLKDGVAGTTLDDVKDAAGVSSSQIYHYFADKRALVLAVIDYQSDTIVGGQEPMFARMDTIDGLRAWRDFLVEHQRQLHCVGGCPIGSLGAELAEIDDRARTTVAATFDRWEAGIRAGLRNMHQRGELAADPDDLALATLAALQGGLLLTQMQRNTRPLEKSLDTMLAHIEACATPA